MDNLVLFENELNYFLVSNDYDFKSGQVIEFSSTTVIDAIGGWELLVSPTRYKCSKNAQKINYIMHRHGWNRYFILREVGDDKFTIV